MDKYLFSIPYVILTGVLFCLYFIEQKNMRLNKSTIGVSWSAFFILLFFLGLRGHIYTDFISYYQFFEYIKPADWTVVDYNFEYGFILYSKIIKLLIPNYYGWVFINTFIDLLALRFVFKRYANSTILPFIFFIAFQGVLMEANLFRNMKALDCFYFSIPYLQDRKFIKYTLLNLIGFTFHASAIIFLPLYFILCIHIKRYVIWIVFIAVNIMYWSKIHITSIIFGFIFEGYMTDKYIGYLESDVGFGFTMGYFERTFSFLLFTLLYTQLIKQRSSNNIFFNCSFLYYSFHILFSDIAVIADRIPFFFIIGNWVLYSNVINCKYKARKLINTGIGILVFLKIILSFSNIGTKYQNLIFGIDSVEKRSRECMENFAKFDASRK